jgi:hypothetical protein
MALDVLFGESGHACGDFAVNWNIDDPALRRSGDQSARFPRMPPEKTLPLQCGEILHDRRLTRESEVFLDLTRAWRQPFGALFRLNELQNIFLPECEHMNMLDELFEAATGKALSGSGVALDGAAETLR